MAKHKAGDSEIQQMPNGWWRWRRWYGPGSSTESAGYDTETLAAQSLLKHIIEQAHEVTLAEREAEEE